MDAFEDYSVDVYHPLEHLEENIDLDQVMCQHHYEQKVLVWRIQCIQCLAVGDREHFDMLSFDSCFNSSDEHAEALINDLADLGDSPRSWMFRADDVYHLFCCYWM